MNKLHDFIYNFLYQYEINALLLVEQERSIAGDAILLPSKDGKHLYFCSFSPVSCAFLSNHVHKKTTRCYQRVVSFCISLFT